MIIGQLEKMPVSLMGDEVSYQLKLSDHQIPLNPLIGKAIKLTYQGEIYCSNCDRKTKKSFGQGHCYPCFQKLARCDRCIMSPELCHFHEGTCREPEWGESFCFQDHYVYLANSSGVKVGITRGTQIPTRWIDQGAVQAVPIARVSNRLLSGKVEVLFKQHVADKTNWRAMLKGSPEPVDLIAVRDQLFSECDQALSELQQTNGLQAVQLLTDIAPQNIVFPVNEFPAKVTSFNFDKNPEVSGVLMGIKGQYLILDTGVINIRKFSAYKVGFEEI